MFWRRKLRSVRLTLKIVKSGDKAFSLMNSPKGVEEIVGKHTEVSVFSAYKNSASKFLASSRLQRDIAEVSSHT
jgi:hypothetical protein